MLLVTEILNMELILGCMGRAELHIVLVILAQSGQLDGYSSSK